MTLAGREKGSFAADVIDVIKRVMLHPLMVATMLRVLSAAVRYYEPPVALDRLMQFRKMRLREQPCSRSASRWRCVCSIRCRGTSRDDHGKAHVDPTLAFTCCRCWSFAEIWVYTAVLMVVHPR